MHRPNATNVTVTEEETSFFIEPDLTYTDLLIEITGWCNGCTNDIGLLSDDVVGRRRLTLETEDELFPFSTSMGLTRRDLEEVIEEIVVPPDQQVVPTDATACECAPDAEQRPPTADELFKSFSQLVDCLFFVTAVEQLDELFESFSQLFHGLFFITAVEQIVEVGVTSCRPNITNTESSEGGRRSRPPDDGNDFD